MSTRVISVRGKGRAVLLADPNFRYVGRRCGAWPKSPWGNPFRAGEWARGAIRRVNDTYDDPKLHEALWALEPIGGPGRLMPDLTAEEACALYRAWVAHHPDLSESLRELQGKTLGCWCGEWEPGQPEIHCHAVVLAKLADATGEGS